MAFGVQITGYARTGETAFTMEPPWWPVNELKADPRFRATIDPGNYLDYTADLSVVMVRELHERFKPRATQGGFACAAWTELIRPMIEELDAALGPPGLDCLDVRVTVFEWESGLS